MTPDLLQEI
jgi:hypothetical protein